MKIFLGFNDYLRKKENKDVPVYWDSDEVTNPHIILCAKSGNGKSYQLLRFIEEALASAGPEFVRYHNLDVHGDLKVPGESRVEFSRATRYGYNPLVLDADPRSGGVERQINFILHTINETSRKIMDKQEACLRNVLTDVYAMGLDRRVHNAGALDYLQDFPLVHSGAIQNSGHSEFQRVDAKALTQAMRTEAIVASSLDTAEKR
jgi:hypothetical protein